MSDTTFVGFCPRCSGAMIEDEPRQACDYRGRTTGDDAEDIFDGTPQSHVGHPGCLTKVEPDLETV
jgi:hypothetical protein